MPWSLDGPSRSAALSAVARALHRDEPPPLVLDDPLAWMLAGPDGPELRDQLCRELPEPSLRAFCRWVCVRARYPEDVVAEAVGHGTSQYVILGAGLDTFAYRRHDLTDRLAVFEVDHPLTQAWKRQRLADLAVDIPAGVVFAPVDFEHQTLHEGLAAAGFRFDAPAVFAWIGVTMYLSIDAIEATLRTVAACAAATRVVLTYNQPDAALDDFARSMQRAVGAIVAGMGEPMVSLFTPAEIEHLVRAQGFDDIAHFGPDETLATYFPGRPDVRIAGAQRLISAAITPE